MSNVWTFNIYITICQEKFSHPLQTVSNPLVSTGFLFEGKSLTQRLVSHWFPF